MSKIALVVLFVVMSSLSSPLYAQSELLNLDLDTKLDSPYRLSLPRVNAYSLIDFLRGAWTGGIAASARTNSIQPQPLPVQTAITLPGAITKVIPVLVRPLLPDLGKVKLFAAHLESGRLDFNGDKRINTADQWYAREMYAMAFRYQRYLPKETTYVLDQNKDGALNGQDTTVVTQAVDFAEGAIAYLIKVVNPDAYRLMGWQTNDDGTVTYQFEIGGRTQVNVTAHHDGAWMDTEIELACLRTRQAVASGMGTDISAVHVNGFEGGMILHFGDRASYYMTTRADDFVLTLNYHRRVLDVWDLSGGSSQAEQVMVTLISLVDRKTGTDLFKSAQNYIKDTFNPEQARLSFWERRGDILGFGFSLGVDTVVNIDVDRMTGIAGTQDTSLGQAALETRHEISVRMGLAVTDVHINDIMGFCHPNYYPGAPDAEYLFTAGVAGRYTLAIHYIDSGSGEPGPIIIDPASGVQILSVINLPYNPVTMALVSFVDNATGRDYVAEARSKVTDLFNPSAGAVQLVDWRIVNGSLVLSVDVGPRIYGFEGLPGYGGGVAGVAPGGCYARTIGDFRVEVDLATGEVAIPQYVIEVVDKTRTGVAEKLQIDRGDVHVNDFTVSYFDYFDGIGFCPTYCGMAIDTPRFSLYGTTDVMGDAKIFKPASIFNKETGIDLLYNAVTHLNETVNPEASDLVDWYVDVDEGSIHFEFMLANGFIVDVGVNIATGDAWMPRDLENACLKIRGEIATRAGLAIEDVRVSGIEPGMVLHFGCNASYFVTASAGELSITMNYLESSLIAEFIGGTEPPITVTDTKIILISVVTKTTGVDLYKEAIGIMDGEAVPIGVTEPYSLHNWYVDRNADGTYGSAHFTFSVHDGSTVKVKIDVYGSVREKVTIRDTYDAEGRLAGRTEEGVVYGLPGATGVYATNASYESGVLTKKTASLAIFRDGETIAYTVTYDVKDGVIVGTHVYDKDGNEVPGLGGEGEVHPSEMIGIITNPPVEVAELKDDAQKIADATVDEEVPATLAESQAEKAPIPTDPEVAERMDIEAQAQAQAADQLFTGEMVTKKVEVPELQKQP